MDLWSLKKALCKLIAADSGGNNFTVPRGLVHAKAEKTFQEDVGANLHNATQEVVAAEVAEELEAEGADDPAPEEGGEQGGGGEQGHRGGASAAMPEE